MASNAPGSISVHGFAMMSRKILYFSIALFNQSMSSGSHVWVCESNVSMWGVSNNAAGFVHVCGVEALTLKHDTRKGYKGILS